MRQGTVLGLDSAGFHRMRYVEWGEADNPNVVLCVHGLTRTGRDFDALAQVLARDFRVVCPDIAGRGRSDWLPVKQDYGYPQYAADITALIARVATDTHPAISFVGTSMGGMLGIMLASRPNTPIARLVVNDVGAIVPTSALGRLAGYVGKDPRFDSFEQLEAHVRMVSAPFGPLDDAQWQHLTQHAARQHADGTWGFAYDPGIRVSFGEPPYNDIDLWRFWDAIACPTLLLRGADSDLLRHDTAIAMTQRGPKPALVEFPGIGHAPTLMSADQIAVVREFLLGG